MRKRQILVRKALTCGLCTSPEAPAVITQQFCGSSVLICCLMWRTRYLRLVSLSHLLYRGQHSIPNIGLSSQKHVCKDICQDKISQSESGMCNPEQEHTFQCFLYCPRVMAEALLEKDKKRSLYGVPQSLRTADAFIVEMHEFVTKPCFIHGEVLTQLRGQ